MAYNRKTFAKRVSALMVQITRVSQVLHGYIVEAMYHAADTGNTRILTDLHGTFIKAGKPNLADNLRLFIGEVQRRNPKAKAFTYRNGEFGIVKGGHKAPEAVAMKELAADGGTLATGSLFDERSNIDRNREQTFAIGALAGMLARALEKAKGDAKVKLPDGKEAAIKPVGFTKNDISALSNVVDYFKVRAEKLAKASAPTAPAAGGNVTVRRKRPARGVKALPAPEVVTGTHG